MISLVLSILFMEVFISRATGLPVRDVLDAVVLSLAFVLLLKELQRNRLTKVHAVFGFSILAFTLLSMFGGLSPSLGRSLVSSIIFSKFIIVFFLARRVSIDDLRGPLRVLAVLHAAGIGLSLVYPNYFISMLPEVSFELDTSRLMGFSLNANRAAVVSVTLALFFWFVERRLLYVLAFTAALALSGSRSVSLIFIAILIYTLSKSRVALPVKILTSAVLVLGILSALFMLYDLSGTLESIDNTLFGDSRYIRAAMLLGGWNLAQDYAPFGVGGGLFGSSLSRDSYAYVLVGISSWDTVVDMTGIYDSGIGAILGEYGFAGLFCYTAITYYVLRKAFDQALPRTTTLFVLGLILFMSFFRTVASDFFFSFFFLFVSLFLRHVSRQSK